MIEGRALGEFGFEDITKLNETFQEAVRQNTMAMNELSFCNRKQEDILHMIEFCGGGKRELGTLGKELRDIRKRRRIAKNTIAVLAPILEWKDNNSSSYLKLSQSIGKSRKIFDEQQSATYRMKAEDDKYIEHCEGDNVQ